MSKYNLTEIENKLKKCKAKNIDEVNVKEIDDIDNIKIDTDKKGFDRIIEFLKSSKNPYVFLVNGVKVRLQFSNNSNITAEDCISRVLKNEYIK